MESQATQYVLTLPPKELAALISQVTGQVMATTLIGTLFAVWAYSMAKDFARFIWGLVSEKVRRHAEKEVSEDMQKRKEAPENDSV
jgi:hypothetical protein